MRRLGSQFGANRRRRRRPIRRSQVAPVATFDSPWALAFLPGTTQRARDREAGPDLAGRSRQRPQAAGQPARRRWSQSSQGGLLDVVLRPTSRTTIWSISPMPSRRPTAAAGSRWPAPSWSAARAARGSIGLQVLWHDPAGGEGGQFGAIIAFAPDGKSLFLSSGERQRFTPAQDPNQPLGKILHLTLDGKPAPGNPWAGRPARRPSRSPIRRTTPKRQDRARPHVAWPGPNLTPAETWSSGPPQSLRPRLRRRRAGCGRPRWARAAATSSTSSCRAGITAGRWSRKARITTACRSPSRRPARTSSRAKLCWVPSISPTSLLIYSGNLFPQWKGNGFIGALSGKALIRVTFNGDQAQKADQWDMGARIRFVGARTGRRNLSARGRRRGPAASLTPAWTEDRLRNSRASAW